MKKFILSIAVVVLTMSMRAQAPDFNFETWSNVPFSSTIQDPNGWASLNSLNFLGTAQSVFKETAAPAVGAASAKITTIKVQGAAIPNPYRPGKDLDTVGTLIVGKIAIFPPEFTYGYTMPSAFPRPSMLSFQCKYTPTGNDSAFILAYLTKKNSSTGQIDTIANGTFATGAIPSYTLKSLTMNYNPAFANVVPDSEKIFISSSIYSHDGAQLGSAFWVDAMTWSGYTGTNDIVGIKNDVFIFPNPANDHINFNCTVDVTIMEITDITGRLIGSYKMVDKKTTVVQTTNFVPGVYLYNLLNDKKEVINRGKFEVAK